MQTAPPDSAAVPAAAPIARPPQRVAWLALAIAAVAGIAAVTQLLWTAPPPDDTSVGLAVTDLAARVAALEAAPAPAPNLTPLTARIEALEATVASLDEAAARREPAPPDPRIDALAAQNDQLRDGLEAVGQRLEAVSATARETEQSQSAARTAERASLRAELAELASLRAELAAVRTRLDDAPRVPGTTPEAPLVLAVARLTDAVTSGAPFAASLSVVEEFAKNDTALAELVAPLLPHAATGIPTQARLTRDFDAIAARLSAPLWPPTGISWIDAMLGKIDSLVTVRRLEDSEGTATPAVRVERALADNDLPRAIAALDGIGGPGAVWVSRAQSRVAADRALAGLRLRVIEALGAGRPTEATQ